MCVYMYMYIYINIYVLNVKDSQKRQFHHPGKSGEAAAEEQGGIFASRHKTPQSKVSCHSII